MIIIREILLKAKRIDNGQWVEGYYITDGVRHYIITKMLDNNKIIYGHEANVEVYAISPYTVCQFTFLTDKDGKKIWENDIVEVIFHSGRIEKYLIWWSREMSMMEAISLKNINFNGHDYWGGQPQIEYSTFCFMMQDPWGDIKEVKVVGNIFNNPELLNNNQ